LGGDEKKLQQIKEHAETLEESYVILGFSVCAFGKEQFNGLQMSMFACSVQCSPSIVKNKFQQTVRKKEEKIAAELDTETSQTQKNRRYV